MKIWIFRGALDAQRIATTLPSRKFFIPAFDRREFDLCCPVGCAQVIRSGNQDHNVVSAILAVVCFYFFAEVERGYTLRGEWQYCC